VCGLVVWLERELRVCLNRHRRIVPDAVAL